jgi:FKBP-type peptidyl-prolyl cis-trans isomerase
MRCWPAVVLAVALIPAAGCDTSSSEGQAAGRARRPPKAEYVEREWVRPPLDAPEWKKQPSGLETWDVREGTGEPVPADNTVVTVHYIGWLTDEKATVFDSSFSLGGPTKFPLRGKIQGLAEGIPGMKPGGIRRLEVPPRLGYGSRGFAPLVPPDATLVYEIELLDF